MHAQGHEAWRGGAWTGAGQRSELQGPEAQGGAEDRRQWPPGASQSRGESCSRTCATASAGARLPHLPPTSRALWGPRPKPPPPPPTADPDMPPGQRGPTQPHALGTAPTGLGAPRRVRAERRGPGAGPALTLPPLPRSAEAQQGHHGPEAAPEGRRPPAGHSGAPVPQPRPLTACPASPAERHAPDRSHGAGEGAEPPRGREAKLPVGALPPAAHPRVRVRGAGTSALPAARLLLLRFPPLVRRAMGRSGQVGAGRGVAVRPPVLAPPPPGALQTAACQD